MGKEEWEEWSPGFFDGQKATPEEVMTLLGLTRLAEPGTAHAVRCPLLPCPLVTKEIKSENEYDSVTDV